MNTFTEAPCGFGDLNTLEKAIFIEITRKQLGRLPKSECEFLADIKAEMFRRRLTPDEIKKSTEILNTLV